MAFIYVIKNDINNKQYVGKTMFPIEKRFKQHLLDAKNNKREHRPLYSAINKYGKEHFSIHLLEEVPNELAEEAEIKWIEKLNTYHYGYNATLGGDGKKYIDYDKIIETFKENQDLTQKEIAEIVGCNVDTVRKVISNEIGNINWNTRKILNKKTHLYFPGKSVRCIETNQVFRSATQAANWLLKEGKISSQKYGRNKIPEVCRGQRKTVGGYHWEYVD